MRLKKTGLTERNSPSLEGRSTPKNVLLCFKRDLPADDDKEKDPQTPALQTPAAVSLVTDPLRGRVHFRTLVVRVFVLNKSTRSKVYKLDMTGLHINQDVFVFDVSVEDPSAMTIRNSFNDLK